MKLFNPEMMKYEKNLSNWEEVVAQGVAILVAKNFATNELCEAIINTTKKFGAYYVLEKGIALLHAKPSNYSLKPGMSFLLLKNNMRFNNEDKYARLIFTLSAPNSYSHMELITKFGQVFTNERLKQKLLKAQSISEIISDLKKEKLWL